MVGNNAGDRGVECLFVEGIENEMSPLARGLIAENGVAVDGVGAEWISRDDKSHVIKI